MTVSSAANAVLAKARAMYGKRLTAQNYTDLLACRSVNEAAAYLKAHTAYADAFEGVTMGSLRRWQIEILLREHLSNNFASLCRYEKSIGDGFYKYFVTLSDVDMLLHSVRYLNSRHPEKNLAKVPDFFVRHSELNAAALETATNVDLLWRQSRAHRIKRFSLRLPLSVPTADPIISPWSWHSTNISTRRRRRSSKELQGQGTQGA